MIILIRRGNEKDFDPSKMRPGEFAFMLDSKKVLATFAAGDVKQLATYQDMKTDILAVTDEIIKDLTSGVDAAETEALRVASDLEAKRDSGFFNGLDGNINKVLWQGDMTGGFQYTFPQSIAPFISRNFFLLVNGYFESVNDGYKLTNGGMLIGFHADGTNPYTSYAYAGQSNNDPWAYAGIQISHNTLFVTPNKFANSGKGYIYHVTEVVHVGITY